MDIDPPQSPVRSELQESKLATDMDAQFSRVMPQNNEVEFAHTAKDRDGYESSDSSSSCSTCSSRTSRSRSRSGSYSSSSISSRSSSRSSISSRSRSRSKSPNVSPEPVHTPQAVFRRPGGRPKKPSSNAVSSLLNKTDTPASQPQSEAQTPLGTPTDASEASRKGLAQNLRTTHSVLVDNNLINTDGSVFPINAHNLAQYIALQAERMRKGEIQFSSLNWYLHSMRKMHTENGWEWDSVRKDPEVVRAWNAAKALTNEAATVRARQRAAKELKAREEAKEEKLKKEKLPSAKSQKVSHAKQESFSSRITDEEETAVTGLASLSTLVPPATATPSDMAHHQRHIDFSGTQPAMHLQPPSPSRKRRLTSSSIDTNGRRDSYASSAYSSAYANGSQELPHQPSMPSIPQPHHFPNLLAEPLPSPVSSPTHSHPDQKALLEYNMAADRQRQQTWAEGAKNQKLNGDAPGLTTAYSTPNWLPNPVSTTPSGMTDQEIEDTIREARRELALFHRSQASRLRILNHTHPVQQQLPVPYPYHNPYYPPQVYTGPKEYPPIAPRGPLPAPVAANGSKGQKGKGRGASTKGKKTAVKIGRPRKNTRPGEQAGLEGVMIVGENGF